MKTPNNLSAVAELLKPDLERGQSKKNLPRKSMRIDSERQGKDLGRLASDAFRKSLGFKLTHYRPVSA